MDFSAWNASRFGAIVSGTIACKCVGDTIRNVHFFEAAQTEFGVDITNLSNSLFNAIDKDGNGAIDLDELRTFMGGDLPKMLSRMCELAGQPNSREQQLGIHVICNMFAPESFRTADTNNDGQVDRKEFVAAPKRCKEFQQFESACSPTTTFVRPGVCALVFVGLSVFLTYRSRK